MSDEQPIPFHVPDIGPREIEAVVEVLESKWLTTGEKCRRFEQEFAAAVGASHAVALNSCTAALHLSLVALGVTAGDLVFMSPYTFAATAEVVHYVGATPVFVDIDSATLNIDPARLRAAVEAHLDGHVGRPAAIVPVHIGGVPCAMEEIWGLARQYDLAVVEDAAHAFPASYHSRPVGSVPEGVRGTACFSFYATKTITTGEGGMLTTEDKEVADRARMMSLHGLSKQAWSRYSGGSWRYDIAAPGFKYNMTDIAAAMGIVQLDRAEEMRRRRAEIAAIYDDAFSGVAAIESPTVPPNITPAWHLYPIRVNVEETAVGRDALMKDLNDQGIGTSVHFIPLHLHSFYASAYSCMPEDYPIATAEFDRVISLPISSAMERADIDRVRDAARIVLSDGART